MSQTPFEAGIRSVARPRARNDRGRGPRCEGCGSRRKPSPLGATLSLSKGRRLAVHAQRTNRLRPSRSHDERISAGHNE